MIYGSKVSILLKKSYLACGFFSFLCFFMSLTQGFAACEDEYYINPNPYLARYRIKENDMYKKWEVKRNIPYGPENRDVFDYFLAANSDNPILVFIHGGYWQVGTKEEFSFVVSMPLRLGYASILLEYELAPKKTVTEITQEVGKFLDVFEESFKDSQGKKRKVLLMGHSAGAQLASMWLDHPAVAGAVLVSGLFDLAPLQSCGFLRKVNISDEDVKLSSPVLHVKNFEKPIFIYYGGKEGEGFAKQAQNYYDALSNEKNLVWKSVLEDEDHFSVLEKISSDPSYIEEWFEALRTQQSKMDKKEKKKEKR